MKRRLFCVLLVAALSVCGGYYTISQKHAVQETVSVSGGMRQQLILDAGHGGEDGGAVSITGVPESLINLAIAKKTDCILGLFGVAPVMLRTTDCSLHDPVAGTLREKKVSDLHNRVARIEETECAVLISIHQNTFQSSAYHGAQVFYGAGEESLTLAQITQEIMRQTLDPENQRAPAKISDGVYLMTHITCPAVLVECGFLSNTEEEALLRSETYQRKIALALTASWLEYQKTLKNEGV